MKSYKEKLKAAYEYLRTRISFQPSIGLVLGSGLGDYVKEVEVKEIIDYKDIPYFPQSTVEGHQGRFILGYIKGVPMIVMQGRVHYYEGYSMDEVVMPIRLMKLIGIKILFLTNAAGGINHGLKAGDFMLFTDHISSFVPSPLIGTNDDSLGVRFPDMSQIYNKDLRKIIKGAAKDLSIDLKEGVYLQTTGPNYESPTEIHMYRLLGADAVGMSTACEAIAARHMGLKICAISCISNMAAGIVDQPLSHEEVQETADFVSPLFQKLVTESVIRIVQEGLL